MALEVLTLIAALLAPTQSEREALDRMEAEVFGAAAPGICEPGDPRCGEPAAGSWLDVPERPVPAGSVSAGGELVTGVRLSGFTVPVVLNGPVKAYIRFFQGRGKYILARWLSRMGRHKARLEALLAKEGAPPELVYVAMIESGFDPTAVSRAQAVGPWQFVLRSGQSMGLRRDDWLDERRSWVRSTQAAARYLLQLQKQFGDWSLALAAYNCGPGTVAGALSAAGERDFWSLSAAGALPLGTTRYVPKIMAAMIIGQDPARYGFAEVQPESPVETAVVHVPGGVDLRQLARTLELEADLLADLNPELRRGHTPPGPEWALNLPASALERFHEQVDSTELQGRVFREHAVRFGERLKDLAVAHGVTQTTLRRLNGMPEGEPRAGQLLLVPADTKAPKPPPPPLLVRTDPGLSVDARGRQEIYFPVPDKMEVSEIAAFFGVASGDVGLWNGLDPQAPVHRGMALRLFVPPEFDLSTALVVPAERVTGVPAGSAAAENALAHARDERPPGTKRVPHTVRNGETLWKIARRYGVSLQALRAENGLGPQARPAPGTVLQVPALEGKAAGRPSKPGGKGYKVVKGDTLRRIARRLKVRESDLRRENRLGDSDRLREGQILALP